MLHAREAVPIEFGAGRVKAAAIVDDAYALTGTTHLWRRGLSFDSPFAATVFDEALTPGRPADLVGFRRRLLDSRAQITSQHGCRDVQFHVHIKEGRAGLRATPVW